MSIHVEVKIDVILHATESEEKIFDSFLKYFGIKQEEFQIQNLMGHFDNPITLLSTNLKKDDAEEFVIKFFEMINRTDFDQIYEIFKNGDYTSPRATHQTYGNKSEELKLAVMLKSMRMKLVIRN